MDYNTKEKIVKVCSIEGCGIKHYGRGYCSKHYTRWRNHGDANYAITIRGQKHCNVEGCLNKYSALGYCEKHYLRFKKYGDPHFVKLKVVRGRPETCIVELCNKKHEALGYCKMHYTRFKKHGDPLYEWKPKACKVKGCTKVSRSWGYCPTHASRYYAHGDPAKTLLNTENDGVCSIEGCDGAYESKGLCNAHYKREQYKENVKTAEGRMKYQAEYARRRANKNKAPFNDHTAKDWMETLKVFEDSCAYCGSEGKMEKDHVVPLSKGGSHAKDNIVPSCVNCNRRKWAIDFTEWYPRQSFYTTERDKKVSAWIGKTLKSNKIQMQLF